jgi:hypothetical protein
VVGSVEFVSQMGALSRLSYMQSSDGAIEELNWVPALCHRRQPSMEQNPCYDGFCSGMTKCLLYGRNCCRSNLTTGMID